MATAETKQEYHGLSSDEATKRLQQYGPNSLVEKKESALLRLLGYFRASARYRPTSSLKWPWQDT